MDEILKRNAFSGSANSTPQREKTLIYRDKWSRRCVSKGSTVLVSSDKPFNIRHTLEMQKGLLDFKQYGEFAHVIPEHIQQLAYCLKVDGLSVFYQAFFKRKSFQFWSRWCLCLGSFLIGHLCLQTDSWNSNNQQSDLQGKFIFAENNTEKTPTCCCISKLLWCEQK